MKNFADLHLRAVRGAVVLLWVGLLVACGSNSGKFPPAPASAGTQNYSYIVGLGDNINIIVWHTRVPGCDVGPGAARRQDLDPADR